MGKLLTEADLAGSKPLLTDADLAGSREVAPASKYPQPKSLTQTDDEVGIGTGPITSARLPGTGLSLPLRQPMSQLEFDQQAAHAAVDVGRVEDALGSAAIGGVASAGVKALTAGKAASQLSKGLTIFGDGRIARDAAKAAPSMFERLLGASKGAVDNAASHMVAGSVLGQMAHHPLIGAAIGVAAPAVAKVAAKYGLPVASHLATNAVAPAVAAGGALAHDALSEPASPAASPLTNAIENLRASAAGNPRAAELLARIERGSSGAGTGEVTQTTGVQP